MEADGADGGAAVVDVWKVPDNNPLPTVANSITGGNYPAITSAENPQHSTNLTGWTTLSAAAWDEWAVEVVSVSNTNFLGIHLECD